MTATAETRARPAYREVELDVEVRRRDTVSDGVVALTLADPTGADLPEWAPGAHIDLLLTPSLVRQYSLCGDTANRGEWQVGVLLDPNSRGGSQFVHDKLHEGAAVRVRGPRNHFPLVGSPRYLFIAGGIGITPMLPMIAAVHAIGADWRLLYGGRSRASMAFVDDLRRYGDRVTLCARDAQDGANFRASLDSVLAQPSENTLVYCCGPEGLLTAVETGCGHWPDETLHIERFSAKALEEPSPDALATFEVECQRSGVTVTVTPDKSIYQACEDAGVDVLGSCMEGVCGTCECDVLEGEPDHRDSVLNDAEKARNDVIMTCVSRSRSERLVLDL
ncbi:PDR/VanB family oxidoreductase [Mycobacterium talmoniae]|uniref:Oxidoreductase n=1 Tax=Mycobacterium talmoniae TaxID=1858794 RepID=A0A1S1NQ70_9MYCO|nr:MULTISPECIES: PDR/VanB family oxidoreductase [Mycobacterium]OHV06500.1 oxidoreductase [Mycobacterium talmoniae]PQM45233.1 Phenoxybenzoate dioxygenase subunit beta [Mycobacterium talmoniae]TDH56125.1 oxidoreductase [Mycobacterium eburneum]